jgi:hypothetical protein
MRYLPEEKRCNSETRETHERRVGKQILMGMVLLPGPLGFMRAGRSSKTICLLYSGFDF